MPLRRLPVPPPISVPLITPRTKKEASSLEFPLRLFIRKSLNTAFNTSGPRGLDTSNHPPISNGRPLITLRHDAALEEMVHELNHLHKAPDRVFNDKDVDSVVERHNARYKKIVMAMSEAKSHSGSNTAWSATVSAKSPSIPDSVAKRIRSQFRSRRREL